MLITVRIQSFLSWIKYDRTGVGYGTQKAFLLVYIFEEKFGCTH
jgi:hypothetical protein